MARSRLSRALPVLHEVHGPWTASGRATPTPDAVLRQGSSGAFDPQGLSQNGPCVTLAQDYST